MEVKFHIIKCEMKNFHRRHRRRRLRNWIKEIGFLLAVKNEIEMNKKKRYMCKHD